MLPDLVKITELFLIPSSFLVAALGTADTNLHRAAVSLLGLVISIMWLVCTREAHRESIARQPEIDATARMRMLGSFPAVFITGWLFSLVMHILLAGVALGQNILPSSN